MRKNVNLDEELKVCENHARQGYCYWGVCRMCGVRQFIRKLMDGEIEHNERKRAAFKKIAEGLK